MKNYLAVFFGRSDAMEAWKALPESERKDREQAGMADHNGVISEMGSPLGKTKRADKNGMSDARNELCAWTVVKANSQEEATRLFLNHPHFTIFPGDYIEVMECLPVPGMA
ncbi:hypothetical protein [Hyphomicrobium sp. DY-1]|uniref:hypothetical protein n=1 Tax=Hyphomicrobium sp. DY-1 TaxID=3075650 RepID=UPI0039C30CF8